MSDAPRANAGPSDAESIDWMKVIQAQMRVCDSENGVLRNLFKRAKSAGENIKALRQAIVDCRGDTDQAIADIRDHARYLSLRRVPITAEAIFSWEQTQHITEKAEQTLDLWDIEEAGYKAGRGGAKTDDCPHPAGSEYAAVWLDWWHKGQAAIARELGPNAERVGASRERPARGRKAAAAETTAAERTGRKRAAGKPKKAAGNGRKRGGRQRALPAPAAPA